MQLLGGKWRLHFLKANLRFFFFSILATGASCLQNVSAAPNAHQAKEKDSDLCRPNKDSDFGKSRAPSEPQSNIFVLRKMVEEVFTVLYSKQFLLSDPRSRV